MMRRVFLIHGFNVSDGGKNTTDGLMPHIARSGWKPVQIDYGWFGLIQVRLCNGGVAETIKAAARRGDIGIGHSNGCAILMEACQRGAQLTGLVLINPALDEDCKVPAQVRWIHVYHNREDSPVKWSRILLLHPWGAMGRHGYQGSDDRYLNVDCYPDVQGHSDIFKKLDRWGPKIVKNIARAINPKVRRAA
jgi:hypothetical protein